MLWTVGAAASDLATFRSLDPQALAQAEAEIHDYLEPGTARLLREPRNEAERYVVQRQQRLAAELMQRPAPIDLAGGEQVQALFWPVAQATQITTGRDGRAEFRCVSAMAILGRELPDFRTGNATKGAVR
jgi:hypothetical protein